MHFILHADLDGSPSDGDFDPPRRSYYSVLRALQPAFELIGSVDIVREPNTEVDPIFDHCAAAGEECFFFSFSPPHKVPFGLRCPTVAVVVWEYSTIPTEIWDELGRSDWRVTLAALGGAVTVCNFTARALKNAMGEDFPVDVVPVAIWDRFAETRSKFLPGQIATPVEFHVDGIVFDSNLLDLSADLLLPPTRPDSMTDGEIARMARGITIKLPSPPPSNISLRLDGIIYTAVFSLSDERKNLSEILTAFCFAFKDVEDATLVIQIVHWDRNDYHGTLVWALSRLSPFKCRVVFIQARLDEETSEKLIGATSYYINASHCEAVGLSLMEFMSCGRPAVAPRHTAMEDYIDESVAFLVDFSHELSPWPQDPRGLFRCERYRIDWESLRDAFAESYRVAKEAPERHREMGQRAMERMRALTATGAVAEKLRAYLRDSPLTKAASIDARLAINAP
jgi:glycosyltransferase involved in cell wall biosynthesis